MRTRRRPIGRDYAAAKDAEWKRMRNAKVDCLFMSLGAAFSRDK